MSVDVVIVLVSIKKVQKKTHEMMRFDSVERLYKNKRR